MSEYPKSVHICEVGLRDGLQIEKKVLSKDEKLHLIDALIDSGITELEVGSFVNPKAVPQMADTLEVLAAMRRRPGVTYRGVWFNQRGLDSAIECGKLDIRGGLSVTASETFSRRNTNRAIEDTFAEMPGLIERYRAAGIEIPTIAVLAAFGCNFEGEVSAATVFRLVERAASIMVDHGCSFRRLSLCDTMGRGTPLQTKRLISAIRDRWPDVELSLHLHDTRGTAIANAVAAMELGVREFDSSIGGLGGCPFAGQRGVAGNICTEDLAYVCEEMGISTGLDIEKLIAAAKLAEELLGRTLPGQVMKAGRSLLPRA